MVRYPITLGGVAIKHTGSFTNSPRAGDFGFICGLPSKPRKSASCGPAAEGLAAWLLRTDAKSCGRAHVLPRLHVLERPGLELCVRAPTLNDCLQPHLEVAASFAATAPCAAWQTAAQRA